MVLVNQLWMINFSVAGLDWMISRNPLQPQLLCISVAESEITFLTTVGTCVVCLIPVIGTQFHN